jgi:hypothetical protein
MQVRPSIKRPMERNLNDPGLRGTFRGLKQACFLEHLEKRILHYLFRFSVVVQNTQRNAKHKPGVPVVDKTQSLRLPCAQASQRLLVAWEWGYGSLPRIGGTFPIPAPGDRNG